MTLIHHKLHRAAQAHAAQAAPVKARSKTQSPGEAKTKKQRKKRGQGRGFFKGAPHVFNQRKSFIRAIIVDPKGLHKTQAIGCKAHAPPVLPKRLRAAKQNGFFKV